MSWIKSYKEFLNESQGMREKIIDFEKLLKLPTESGIFQSLAYDNVKKTLMIEQPTDISAMDSGAVLAAINREKTFIKKAYPGIQYIIIGDLQIKIS